MIIVGYQLSDDSRSFQRVQENQVDQDANEVLYVCEMKLQELDEDLLKYCVFNVTLVRWSVLCRLV